MRSLKNPLPGDILLLRQAAGKKSLNRWAQSLLRTWPASYSHVAITLDRFHAIHAMPETGVAPAELDLLIGPDSGVTFTALRCKQVEADPGMQTRIRSALNYHMNQPYNRLFFARLSNNSSYCSELAAKSYLKVGIRISHRSPRFVLPEDLANLRYSSSFKDVTTDYTDDLSDIDPSELTPDVVTAAMQFNREMAEGYKVMLETEQLMHSTSLEMEEVSSLHSKVYQFLKREKHALPMPPQYWDSRRARRRAK